MEKFNLSKGEEDTKPSKFNLSKGEDVPVEAPKSSKFNLSKGDDASEETSKSSKFNLGKSAGAQQTVENKPAPVDDNKSKTTQQGIENPKDGKAVAAVDGNTQHQNKKGVDTHKTGKTSGGGATTASTTTSDSGKKHTGLWILLAALVVGGIICAVVLSKNQKTVHNETPVEQVVDSPENENVAKEPSNLEEPVSEQSVEESVNEETPGQTTSPTQSHQSNQQSSVATNPAHTAPSVANTRTAASSTNNQKSRETLSSDLEQNANAVIRGEFGNYPKRKAAIEALGGNYEEIQNKVNEIYRAKSL